MSEITIFSQVGKADYSLKKIDLSGLNMQYRERQKKHNKIQYYIYPK